MEKKRKGEKAKKGSKQLEEEMEKKKKRKGATERRNGKEEEKLGKGATAGEKIEGFRVLFFKQRVEIKYENGGCRWLL